LDGLAWKEGAGFHKATTDGLKGYINLQGIASDRTGRVFIATRRGIAVTSPPAPGKEMDVTFLPWPASVQEHRSSAVYAVSPNEVWFDCDVAICLWNGRDVRVWNDQAGVPRRRWEFFLKDRAGNLWARNRDFFIELSAGADRFQTISPDLAGPIPIPSELAMDRKGRILVTTSRGIVIGGPSDWRRVSEKQGLPDNYVTAFLEDGEGSMWLGTYGSGLVRWAGYEEWRSFTELEGLASSSIASLLEDPPRGMWAGTGAGLSHGLYSNGSWNWSEISIPGVSLASSLTRSKDGAIWMSTDGHYVVRYDPVSRTSRRLGPFVAGPFHLRIDGAGRLWIADEGSVAVGGTGSRLEDFERIRPPGSTAGTQFSTTVEDDRGNLWIGSMSGLFLRSQGKWLRFDTNSGLRAIRVRDLALSPEGDLWVAYTESKGVDRVRLTGDTLQVEHFDRSKGLTSDGINSIAFDRLGRLWILNDHGAEFRRGDAWVQFSRTDGLIASGSTGRAFWASADGAIWVGSERGLSQYSPADRAGPHDPPLRVRFSEIRVGSTLLDPESASFVEATPQVFEAKFSALLLAHASDVQYRYRFVGFDDRWQETARPEVRLEYPPPGQYRLEVQGRLHAQPWSEPVATFALQVRPRWYQTLWIRGTLVALVCGGLWLLEHYRRKKVALKRALDQRTAELRENEERYQTQKMETLGRLAAGVAHDFNNLLTVINGYGRILRDRLAGDPELQRKADQVCKAGASAATLTEQLLAFSQRRVIPAEALDMNAVIRASVGMLERLLGVDVGLVADLAPDLYLVMSTVGEIQQVLMNLAANARDAMATGGTLTIRTWNVEAQNPEDASGGPFLQCGLLEVEDTGEGIAPEYLTRIFEPFFTMKSDQGGTGLGLATVHGLVRQRRGWIEVNSRVGEGASFRVFFPKAPETAPVHRSAKGSEVARAGATILLAEDQAEVRRFASEVLHSNGYNVLEAENGEQALQVASSFDGMIDLLVSDVIMPTMRGTELAAHMQGLRAGLPVILVSGYNPEGHTGSPGAVHLNKPFSPEQLMEAVAKALAGREKKESV
jgi:signal transduction histidine kinase/CheY-like chemotaxis protein/streptogramin lyase